MEVSDLQVDGRDELVVSGASATERYSAIVVFRDGRLRKVTDQEGRPFELGSGGSDTRGGRTVFGARAWGCEDAAGARGIVRVDIRRGRGDRDVLRRTVDRLRGSITRPVSRSSRTIRHQSRGGRGARAYVSACPTRSIHDP